MSYQQDQKNCFVIASSSSNQLLPEHGKNQGPSANDFSTLKGVN